jgi:murein DD-endopeptidase MepM/ murein hydrolase activator NlpD
LKLTGDAMRGQLGTLRRQVIRKFDQLFAPREILLRSDDRVKYVRITRRQQVTAAALASGFAGWTLLATIGTLGAALFVWNGGPRFDDSAAAYAQLRDQIVASRGRIVELLEGAGAAERTPAASARHVPDADVSSIQWPSPLPGGETATPRESDAALAALSDTSADLQAVLAANAALSREAEALRLRVAALEEVGERAVVARDRFAATWRATELRLAAQRSENAVLAGQIAALDASLRRAVLDRDGFAADWRAAERQLTAQQSENAALADEVAALQAQNESLELGQAGDAAVQVVLNRQVAELSDQLSSAAEQNARLQATVAGMQRTVAQIADDRIALRLSRNELSSQVAFIEKRMSSLQALQQTIVQRLTERTRGTVAEVEKTVLMTGLDLEGLLKSAADLQSGQGGPFVPTVRSMRSAEDLKVLASIQKLGGEVDRWARLQLVLRTLPLASPLDSYLLMSGFGERRDPFNGKTAFHAGVDLKNEVGAPVLATAPGTVVYAGWMGDYGRIVDIDHGLGIHTRYAHLKSIAVKVGEQVDFRQEIGKLGKSGRSTGPHVHYEVQVNGKPHDPMNFMEAGTYVFKG